MLLKSRDSDLGGCIAGDDLETPWFLAHKALCTRNFSLIGLGALHERCRAAGAGDAVGVELEAKGEE